jgi:hypothetical protein
VAAPRSGAVDQRISIVRVNNVGRSISIRYRKFTGLIRCPRDDACIFLALLFFQKVYRSIRHVRDGSCDCLPPGVVGVQGRCEFEFRDSGGGERATVERRRRQSREVVTDAESRAATD